MEVPVSGNTQVKRVTKDETQVKKVIVGRPVRRIRQARIDIINIIEIEGIDLSNLQDGSVLVYNESTTNFESTVNLEKQNINGGNY